MDERLKQRLVGAVVLVAAAVIFVPMILESPPAPDEREPATADAGAPPSAADTGGFSSRIVPLAETGEPDGGAGTDTGGAAATAVPDAEPVPEPAPGPEATVRAPPPEPAPPAEAADAAPAERVGVSAWAVQVGSFARAENAATLLERIEARGYDAFVETAPGEEGTVTRVLVGPALEREAADAARRDLEEAFGLRGLVVRYTGG